MNLPLHKLEQALMCSFLVTLLIGMQDSSYAEIRTYQFESGSYSSSCGECSRWFNVQADIEGSFSVAIDYANQQGALLDLTARITAASEIIATITHLDGAQHVSFERIPIPINEFGSELNLDWLIGDSGWKGFLSVDNGTTELSSTTVVGGKNDLPVLLLPTGYTAAMTGLNEATLSISHHALDYSFGISILSATRVVPEPHALAMLTPAILFFFHRRTRI